MIPVTTSTAARAVLVDIIEQSNNDLSGTVARIHGEGISPEFIDNLRNRSMQDIIEITEHPEILGISYSVDAKRITGYLALIDLRKKDGELGDFEYFVKNGAEQTLICRLFSKSIEDVRHLASLFPRASGKRPPDDLCEEINEEWAQLCSYPNMRKRIRALHQMFSEWSITS